MTTSHGDTAPVEVFTVCPPHAGLFGGAASLDGMAYADLLEQHCRWAEKMSASAMLIYEFWQALDPWQLAQNILARTSTLETVVAVTPGLSHPALVARRLATLHHLHGRRVSLNLVTGAKTGERAAFGDPGPADRRYARLAEFADCTTAVLRGEPHEGEHYRVDLPAPDPTPPPRLLAPASGSDGFPAVLPHIDQCLVMAKPIDHLAAEHRRLADGGLRGGLAMIVGVVARETDDEARRAARQHYRGNRRDALVGRAFRQHTTSSQHRVNFALADRGEEYQGDLWYGADRIGVDCPKLVGSYRTVAAAIDRYRSAGVRTVVVDLPHDVAEYEHVSRALAHCAGSPRNPAFPDH